MKKRIISFFIVALMLASVFNTAAFAAEKPQITATLDSKSAKEGETVTLYVTLDRSVNITGGCISFDFPTGITVLSGEWGFSVPYDSGLASSLDSLNNAIFVLSNSSKNTKNLFKVVLKVENNVNKGENNIGIQVKLDGYDVTNVNGKLKVACGHYNIGKESYSFDENEHWEICPDCKEKISEEHHYQYSSNQTVHWLECTACHIKKEVELHIYDAMCDEICNICGAERTTSHNFDKDWSGDENEHWHECADCHKKKDNGKHEYNNVCDESCNICGAIRNAPHIPGKEWLSDKSGHWHECTNCHKKSVFTEHNAGKNGLCTECGYRVYTHGDLDGVDGISSDDAIYLLYHVYFKSDYPVNQDCDFDGSGELDSDDAIYLLYYVYFPDDYPLMNVEDIPVVYSKGLVFKEYADGCELVGLGSCKDDEIYIPDTYNGKPVLSIGEEAFYFGSNGYNGKDTIKKVVVPEGCLYFKSYINCTIEKLVLPSTITYINYDFETLSMSDIGIVEKITIRNNPYYKMVNHCLVDVENKTVIHFEDGFVIPTDGSVNAVYVNYYDDEKDYILIPEGITVAIMNLDGGETINLPHSLKCLTLNTLDGNFGYATEKIIYNGKASEWNKVELLSFESDYEDDYLELTGIDKVVCKDKTIKYDFDYDD